MADPVNTAASRCGDCGLLEVSKTDPLDVLRRLPAEIVNLDAPEEEFFAGSEWDDEVIADDAVFGVVPGKGVTVQYEFARFFAEEKDAFRKAWAQAKALQLALGRMSIVDGKVTGQCPRAVGVDLDRIGQQFGVGRPPGFTDCCYWRLVTLVAFLKGSPPLLLVELAELFTGTRPALIEEPAKITLRWPVAGTTPVGRRPGQRFFNTDGFYNRKGFWGSDSIGETAVGRFSAYFSTTGSYYQATDKAPGIPTLRDVLEQVKPAGVYLSLENLPTLGSSGCMGATKRGRPARRGFYTVTPEVE